MQRNEQTTKHTHVLCEIVRKKVPMQQSTNKINSLRLFRDDFINKKVNQHPNIKSRAPFILPLIYILAGSVLCSISTLLYSSLHLK